MTDRKAKVACEVMGIPLQPVQRDIRRRILPVLGGLLLTLALGGCAGKDFLGSNGFDVSGLYSGRVLRSPMVYDPADSATFPCLIMLQMRGDSVTGTADTGPLDICDTVKLVKNIFTGRVTGYTEGLANVEGYAYNPVLTFSQAKAIGSAQKLVLRVLNYDDVVEGEIIPADTTCSGYYFSLLLKQVH